MKRVYFVSDTGAAFGEIPNGTYTQEMLDKMARGFMAKMPGYRQCSHEEWLAKRREQQNEERKDARKTERENRMPRG